MGVLALSLLGRLELELMEPRGESSPSKWARYPTQVRVSVQLGDRRSRKSKSAPAPAFIFDTTTERKKRARDLTKMVLIRLLRELVGKTTQPLHIHM
jgi:hypothetical protein